MSKLSHIPGLDGLRALAIVAVIFCHANIAFGVLFPAKPPISEGFGKIAGAGWVGVDLFFVLSGFLITRILLAAKGNLHFFRNFYIRRTLRIAPLYYFYAVLVLFILPALGNSLGFTASSDLHAWDIASVLLYFHNIRVAFVGRHLPLVNHLWSLSIEEHFYLVWPVAVAVFSSFRLRQIALVGFGLALVCRAAVVSVGMPILVPYLLTPCRIDGLLLGSFLSVAQIDDYIWDRVNRWAPYTLAGSALGLIIIAIYQGHFYDFIAPGAFPGVQSSYPVLLFGISALAIFFASVLVFTLRQGWLSQFLEHPALVKVGKYSYGIYVYHMLVVWAGMHLAGWADARFIHSASLSKFLLTIFILLGSTALAAASFKFLESPILSFKSRFQEVREEKKTVESVASVVR